MTLQERNSLVIENISLADRIAFSASKKIPKHIQIDEIKSAAYMGLVGAAIKYDGRKPFDEYAPYRIYGEIKDYIKSFYAKTSVELSEDVEYTEQSNFEELIEKLNNTEKKVVTYYYHDGYSMKQIAVKLNLSVTRVFQLLKKCLEKLKND